MKRIEYDSKEIGRRLVFIRERKNISPKEAAEYLGITTLQLLRFEKGYDHDSEESLAYILKMSELYDVSVDYLMKTPISILVKFYFKQRIFKVYRLIKGAFIRIILRKG